MYLANDLECQYPFLQFLFFMCPLALIMLHHVFEASFRSWFRLRTLAKEAILSNLARIDNYTICYWSLIKLVSLIRHARTTLSSLIVHWFYKMKGVYIWWFLVRYLLISYIYFRLSHWPCFFSFCSFHGIYAIYWQRLSDVLGLWDTSEFHSYLTLYVQSQYIDSKIVLEAKYLVVNWSKLLPLAVRVKFLVEN